MPPKREGPKTRGRSQTRGATPEKRKKRDESYDSIDLPVTPMSQHMPGRRYDNACHAAVTGMTHRYFTEQGFMPSGTTAAKDVKDVAKRLYKGKNKPSLDAVADIEQAFRSAGMSSEGLGTVSKGMYRRPSLNGKESVLEKLHDRTPIPIALTQKKALAKGSKPLTNGHYVLGVGASKSRKTLKYIDPADAKLKVKEVAYDNGDNDEGRIKISGQPHYMGAMYAAYPSDTWQPPASTRASSSGPTLRPRPAPLTPKAPAPSGFSSGGMPPRMQRRGR